MKAASENLETLKNPTVIKELTRVLKINDRVCKSVGPSFSKQMGRIFLEMMNLYKAFSQFVSTRSVTLYMLALSHCMTHTRAHL